MFDVKDALKQAFKLHVAARIVRLPPSDIPVIARHTAINTGTGFFAAVAILIANQLFTPGHSLGLSVAIVAAIISAVFIVVFGFLVNLVTPDVENFEIEEADNLTVTNKWATYLFVSFILSILVFILANSAFLMFGISLQRALIETFMISGDRAVLVMTVAAAVIAVTIILWKCWMFRQIKPGRLGSVMSAFVVGAVLNGFLFRYLAFPFE
jgi:hypothetical protein